MSEQTPTIHIAIKSGPKHIEDNLFSNCVPAGSEPPELCITFINNALYNRYEAQIRSEVPGGMALYKRSIVHAKLRECAPPPSTSLLLISPLCISRQLETFTYCYFCKPDPPLDEATVTLNIPRIPGVRVHVTELYNDDETQPSAREVISKFGAETPRCVLLFVQAGNSESRRLAQEIVEHLRAAYPAGVEALGVFETAYHESSQLQNGGQTAAHVSLIAFCGENIRASSVLIPETESDLESRLRTLRGEEESPPDKDSCVALMFPEQVRGGLCVFQQDMATLNTLYPGVQVAGMRVADILVESSISGLTSAVLPSEAHRPADWPADQRFCFKRSQGPSQVILLDWGKN